jgi:hypothetical protein
MSYTHRCKVISFDFYDLDPSLLPILRIQVFILRPTQGLGGVIMVCCTKTRYSNVWEKWTFVTAVAYGPHVAQN